MVSALQPPDTPAVPRVSGAAAAILLQVDGTRTGVGHRTVVESSQVREDDCNEDCDP